MLTSNTKVRVTNSCMLNSIRGKEGVIVRAANLNANDVPGYIVLINDQPWALYADEVEPI